MSEFTSVVKNRWNDEEDFELVDMLPAKLHYPFASLNQLHFLKSKVPIFW